MRLFSIILLGVGCADPDMADYCGEPVEAPAAWSDGTEFSAADLRDGLVGLWEGTARFDGVDEAATLVINEPTDDPVLLSYPDAGEGYHVSVSDSCMDTLRVSLPAQLVLDDSGVDQDFELFADSTGFVAGWSVYQTIAVDGCTAEPCGLNLNVSRTDPDSDTLSGKLVRVDTSAADDQDAVAPDESGHNLELAQVTE